MKNYLMFALLIGAASTVAFGQTVTCDGCTHDVSVYMGEGGLIAESDADEVVWVTTCDGVTVSGELTPNDDGKVSMLFDDMNGLACHSDKGSLQLGPIMDGGWYWITDDMNSAVGGLVGKDIQDNDTVDITSAGDGVTMTAGKGAVYLKETATGRVGILPNILAEPPMEAPTPCGAYWHSRSETVRQHGDGATESCMLDAEFFVVMTSGDGSVAGARITNGMVTRNYNGEKTVTVGLYGTGFVDTAAPLGTGFYSLNEDRTERGTPLVPDTDSTLDNTTNGWTVTLGEVPGFGSNEVTAASAGITPAAGSVAGTLTLTIGDFSNDGSTGDGYCTDSRSSVATVNLKFNPDSGATAAAIVPGIPADYTALGLPDLRPSATLKVMCPAAAPSQGTELVPDNPFPTE